jgi:hypothetical protein
MMEQLETGNIGIGNTSTLATLNNDRFIIVDQKEIFWTGASLKDAGRLTFAAAKMGEEVIPGLLDSIRKATSERREYGKGKKATGATAKGRK